MTEARHATHLDEAVKEITKGDTPNNSFFNDAYSGLKTAGDAVKHTVQDHPVACGTAAVAAGAAIVFLATRQGGGKMLNAAMAEGAESKTLGGAASASGAAMEAGLTPEAACAAKAATEKLAAQTAERAGVLKEVGVIPDVERPMLNGALKDVPAHFAKAAEGYNGALSKLHYLPTSHTSAVGEDMAAVAKKALEERAAITGERLTPEAIADETKRIAALNPGLDAGAGKALPENSKVVLFGEGDMTRLAEKTQFKFVPQLGQFLKENGVTEEQITKALDIQKAQPADGKKLLGQILTDEGLATKEQVDAAFGKQGALKKVLAEVRKNAGF